MGAIVAAGLLTAAIIISADIRARSAVNPTPTPSPPQSSSSSRTAADPAAVKSAPTDASAFGEAWSQALSILRDALTRLDHTPVTPAQGWVDGVTAAWLGAAASNGKTQNLHQADDQATLHTLLTTGQAEGSRLEQPEPGLLVWHTPSGRTYTTTPTRYAS